MKLGRAGVILDIRKGRECSLRDKPEDGKKGGRTVRQEDQKGERADS